MPYVARAEALCRHMLEYESSHQGKYTKELPATMPIYEYRCSECSKTFDILHRTTRISETKCPSCGSERVARLVSAFAVNHGLTPCGTRAADAPPSCGIGAGDSACASCCRVPS